MEPWRSQSKALLESYQMCFGSHGEKPGNAELLDEKIIDNEMLLSEQETSSEN